MKANARGLGRIDSSVERHTPDCTPLCACEQLRWDWGARGRQERGLNVHAFTWQSAPKKHGLPTLHQTTAPLPNYLTVAQVYEGPVDVGAARSAHARRQHAASGL
eukprot:scaffold20600_cov47-Phaeocystis_antarctica.AAC.1